MLAWGIGCACAALGGILMSFAALLIPLETIQEVTQELLYAIVALPVLNLVLIYLGYRKDRRSP